MSRGRQRNTLEERVAALERRFERMWHRTYTQFVRREGSQREAHERMQVRVREMDRISKTYGKNAKALTLVMRGNKGRLPLFLSRSEMRTVRTWLRYSILNTTPLTRWSRKKI